MAITVGGVTYRTLDDVLYLNGKRVTEAHVDGVLVYPDDEQSQYFMIHANGKKAVEVTCTVPGLVHSSDVFAGTIIVVADVLACVRIEGGAMPTSTFRSSYQTSGATRGYMRYKVTTFSMVITGLQEGTWRGWHETKDGYVVNDEGATLVKGILTRVQLHALDNGVTAGSRYPETGSITLRNTVEGSSPDFSKDVVPGTEVGPYAEYRYDRAKVANGPIADGVLKVTVPAYVDRLVRDVFFVAPTIRSSNYSYFGMIGVDVDVPIVEIRAASEEEYANL